MAKQKASISVNPQVIKWTIESSGWEIEELANKLNVEPKTIKEWQSKEHPIDIKKLENLAEKVKRPLAVFFLPKPPVEPKLTDYRRVGGIGTEKISQKTLLAIRKTQHLQSVASELFELSKKNPKPKITTVASLKVDPEEAAAYEREKLGFNSEKLLLSKEAKSSINNFYRILKQQIESFNVFVFQSSIPIRETRGFTLTDSFPRIIVINSADDYKPRIFTLLHEYGHVLLKSEGICLPLYEIGKSKSSQNQIVNIEKWCNSFAASVLAPRNLLLDELYDLDKKEKEPKEIVTTLSSRFKMSHQATVIRILNLKPRKIFLEPYRKHLIYLMRIPETKDKKKGGGGIDPVIRCLSEKGRNFVSLVMDSRYEKIINSYDVVDYLDLKIKHFKRLQEKF